MVGEMIICGREEDPVHSPGNKGRNLAHLLIEISSRVRNQDRVAFVGSQILYTPQDLRIKRTRKLGQNYPDDVRPLHAKAARQEVGLVIQSLNSAVDLLGQFLADCGLSVDDGGNGRDRDFRKPTNI